MQRWRPAHGILFAAWLPLAALATDLSPADFLWRATLEVPPQASVVRVQLPAEALMRMQTAAGHDLRVYDGQGHRLPFAFNTPTPPTAPERRASTLVPALVPSAAAGPRPPRGTHVAHWPGEPQPQAMWLRPAGTEADPGAPRPISLPGAVFDTRSQTQPWSALVVEGRYPANALVTLQAWVSEDLSQWTAMPLTGRIYRFDGDDAPANDTLELGAPLSLAGRYLRIDWPGQPGVRITAVTGLIGPPPASPRGPGGLLPDPLVRGPVAAEWHLGFATPLAELHLLADRPDSVAPVRVLGRNRPTDPWRALAHGVVYRQGPAGREVQNGPISLPRAPVRLLRVEATHGARLDRLGLRVRALFDPLEVVFVTAGLRPYQLAVGRAYTPPGAMPISMLAATTPTRVDALPLAGITQTNTAAPPEPPLWQRWVPSGVDSRAAGLWAVLGVGALAFAALGWSLLRTRLRPRH